jgi:hypothetical protein
MLYVVVMMRLMITIIFFSDRGFDTSSPFNSRKLWLPSQARALPPDDGKREGNRATARWQMDGSQVK